MSYLKKIQLKTRLLIIIVGTIILSSIIFVLIWNNIPKECDDKCEHERRKIESGTRPEGFFEQSKVGSDKLQSFSDFPEITNFQGKNCNELGFADTNCFVDSFNQCLPAKIKNTHNTIEGDPITIIAMIQSETICSIDVFHDSTQDKFGKQEITKYTCPEIKLDERYLHFVHCKSEFDDFEYGLSIRK